jgi:hypothetical protein
VCCYIRCHGNAVKEFGALRDNICDHVCAVKTVAIAMLLKNLGHYGIIFDHVCVCVCVVKTVAMVMLLRDLGHYGIIFVTMCVLLKPLPW